MINTITTQMVKRNACLLRYPPPEAGNNKKFSNFFGVGGLAFMSGSVVYIVGHRNPDTDSICSALAYADLKRQLGHMDARACRLGALNQETLFALAHFGVDQPELLPDVHLRVSDLEYYKPEAMGAHTPLKKAWGILTRRASGARLIPVADENGLLLGTVGLADLTKVFIDASDEKLASGHEILFTNLVGILDGELLHGNYPHDSLRGAFYIASSALDPSVLTPEDIVFTAQSDRAAQFASGSHCGCVIMTGGADYQGDCLCRSLMRVPHSLFKAANMVPQAVSLGSVMPTDTMVTFTPDSYVDDILEIIKTASHRNFPVIDEEGRYLGVISRRHFIECKGKKIILVDHNEQSQSVDGLEQAEILEIIDHHRIADIQTSAPLFIRAEPVGSTATIIYKMYGENGRTPPPSIAGLLLSAILSDTLMFHSPTVTYHDRVAAGALAAACEIHDMREYGRKLFEAGSTFTGLTAKDILSIDRKPFTFGQHLTYISQIIAIDTTELPCTHSQIVETMDIFAETTGAALVMLMITDILSGGSELLFSGKSAAMAARAFGADKGAQSVRLPGVVSRKKQIIPKLAASYGM